MDEQPQAESLGKVRNPVVMVLLLIITINIYWVVWLYKIYSEIRRRSTDVTGVTPGKAAGFIFIPVFNIFWAFYIIVDFPRAIRRLQEADPPTGNLLNNSLVVILLIVGLLINIIIAQFQPAFLLLGEILLIAGLLMSQEALNGHWRAHQAAAGGPAPEQS
ncbi:MAG: DUF4234 domain-containing protein [Candidatus Glassbacteria bacterium]|nr:DUF4234 domain-containing protein [Candidatus Glassbacteria bacterium]